MSVKQFVQLENYMKYKIAIDVTHQKYIYHNRFLDTHKKLLSKIFIYHKALIANDRYLSPHCLDTKKNPLF